MIEAKDLTQEQLDEIDVEVRRRSAMTIRSDEGIRKDLIAAKLKELNGGENG